MFDCCSIVPEYFNRRNYYKKFIREIREGKPLSDLKELEPRRESLKYLFEHCPKITDYDPKTYIMTTAEECPDLIECLSSKEYYCWYNYVNTIIYIVMNAKEEDIKVEKLEKFYNVFGDLYHGTFINNLLALLLPEQVANASMYYYLVAFDNIIDVNGKNWRHEVDTGVERLNGIFNYLAELSKEIPLDKRWHVIRILSFLVSYMYLNNITDYSYIENYIRHTDYYLEKLKSNKCEILNNGTYDFENIRYVFNNFYDIFCPPKMMIR